MRFLLEAIGAGFFIYLFATGTAAWLNYRAKANAALAEKEARPNKKVKS